MRYVIYGKKMIKKELLTRYMKKEGKSSNCYIIKEGKTIYFDLQNENKDISSVVNNVGNREYLGCNYVIYCHGVDKKSCGVRQKSLSSHIYKYIGNN